MTESAPPQVRDNPSEHRFEIWAGDRLAGFTAYHVVGGLYTFTHTEIGNAFEGQGLGSVLVRRAMDEMRHRGAAVAPYCPFVRGYLDRHREYIELVPEEIRTRFGLAG